MPPVRAYVGLGANLGDAAATLRIALADLAAQAGVQCVRASPFYRSAPVDARGPDFINAAAAIDTTLDALALLDALQAIETRHGRERPYKNAPRTLDMDLLLYGDETIATNRLTVPHPCMHERAFVLLPLRDLAPTLTLPQGALSQLLGQLGDQRCTRADLDSCM